MPLVDAHGLKTSTVHKLCALYACWFIYDISPLQSGYLNITAVFLY